MQLVVVVLLLLLLCNIAAKPTKCDVGHFTTHESKTYPVKNQIVASCEKNVAESRE